MSKSNTTAEELKEYDQFNKFDIAYLYFVVNTNKYKEEGSGKTDLTYKRQLIKSLLSQAGNMFPTQETLGSTVMQLYKQKRNLFKIDPDWKFQRSDLGYAAEVAAYLDHFRIGDGKTLDISDVSKSVKICQHLYHVSRTMKKKNPLWELEGK